ncbi:MAG: hypothetical protein ACTSWN_00345 [Promethearchaeota archaeon]
MRNMKIFIGIWIISAIFTMQTIPRLLFLMTMQIPGDFIDKIRPAMPFFNQILTFAQLVLIPFGYALTDQVLTPIFEAIPRGDVGIFVFTIIFIGILTLAIFMNFSWRPLGYEKTEKYEKKHPRSSNMNDFLRKNTKKGKKGPGEDRGPSCGVGYSKYDNVGFGYRPPGGNNAND